MEELTVRLPAETKQSLQADAAMRGVTISEHVRDIIDSYYGNDQQQTRPTVEIEYDHVIGGGREQSETDSQSEPGRTEEIGSFSYGSRSIFR